MATKLRQLRAPYKALLSDPDWLPAEFQQPSGNTTMGHGIASLLLYRSELKDLSLSTLVVAPGLATPVHNHLAWGLVGLYQGDQEEEEYEAHDHETAANFRPLNLRKKRVLKKGDFYELVPPWNDVHRVRTISLRTICQLASIGERHRLRGPTEIRSRKRTYGTVSLRLEQCAVRGSVALSVRDP